MLAARAGFIFGDMFQSPLRGIVLDPYFFRMTQDIFLSILQFPCRRDLRDIVERYHKAPGGYVIPVLIGQIAAEFRITSQINLKK